MYTTQLCTPQKLSSSIVESSVQILKGYILVLIVHDTMYMYVHTCTTKCIRTKGGLGWIAHPCTMNVTSLQEDRVVLVVPLWCINLALAGRN